MIIAESTQEALRKLFHKNPIADLNALFPTLNTNSRMSVFRQLRKMQYLSSYSHAGKYYTLPNIPNFDKNGLWEYNGVFFSRHGTLKSTIRHLVENANAGYTHDELKRLLSVRVQNSLKSLVDIEAIGREIAGKVFLYVHSDGVIANKQIKQRHQLVYNKRKIDSYIIIQILLKIIHNNERNPAIIARTLQSSGLNVTIGQIEEIFTQYNIKKKNLI